MGIFLVQELSQSDAGEEELGPGYGNARRRSNPFQETAAALRRSRRKASHRWRSITRNMKPKGSNSGKHSPLRAAQSTGNIVKLPQPEFEQPCYASVNGQARSEPLYNSDFSDSSSRISSEDVVRPLQLEQSGDEAQDPLPPPPPLEVETEPHTATLRTAKEQAPKPTVSPLYTALLVFSSF
ncbi:hypothetical protein Ciccas_002095 [Cichlidogyrus casuarinus]|uniref:Uncharacterized protein n=1 Tax=Cichlidogyrus casuarinus TaxID=1844966 RepID=A0ABD2QI96_9PLAT